VDDLERALRDVLTDERLDVPLRSGAAQLVHEGVRRRSRHRVVAATGSAVGALLAIGAAAVFAGGGLGDRESVVPGGDDHSPTSSAPAPTPSTPPTKPAQPPASTAEIAWSNLPDSAAAMQHYPGTVADPSVPWCDPTQLTATTAFQGGGGGAIGSLAVHNGGAECALQGEPSVAGLDRSGHVIALPRPTDTFRVHPWVRVRAGGDAASSLSLSGLGARCVGTVVALRFDLGHGATPMTVPATRAGGTGSAGLPLTCDQGGTAMQYDVIAGEWLRRNGTPRLKNSGLEPTILDQDRTVMAGSVLHFRVALSTVGGGVDPCIPFREQLVTAAGSLVAGEDHMLDCQAISDSGASQLTLDMQLRVPSTAPAGDVQLRWETPIVGVQADDGATVTVTAAPPQCTAAQLNVGPGRSGVGLGNYVQYVILTNTSGRDCSLRGFPGVQFVNGAGQPLPTRPHHGSSYFWGTDQISSIVLAPGGRASFGLAGSDYDNVHQRACPQAAGIKVIPPGLTTQQLVSVTWPDCYRGRVDVSPVVAGRHGPR
jgi:hypothetical protein